MKLIPQAINIASNKYKFFNHKLATSMLVAMLTVGVGNSWALVTPMPPKNADIENKTLEIEGSTTTGFKIDSDGSATSSTDRWRLTAGSMVLDLDITGIKVTGIVGNTALTQDALSIKNTTATPTLDLTASKLIITKDGELISKSGKGLKIANDTSGVNDVLKSDIENHGKIVGGVSIESTGTIPLVAPTGNTAKFDNYGAIYGGFTIQGNETTTTKVFQLTNHYKACIEGTITKNSKSKIKFNLINNGKISFAAHATQNLDIDSYSGSGEMYITGIKTGVLKCAKIAGDVTFKSGSKIVISASSTISSNSTLTLVESASKSITIAEGVDELLYTTTDHPIVGTPTANTQCIKLTQASVPAIASGVAKFLDYIKISRFDHDVQEASSTAALAKTTGKIAGIEYSKLLDTSTVKSANPAYWNLAMSAEGHKEKVDRLLPDTSNTSVLTSAKVGQHLVGQIQSRVAGKGLSAANNVRVGKHMNDHGINSGELVENIDAWAGFSYNAVKEKASKDKQAYSESSIMVFSFGADTTLENDITVGACYGFSSATTEINGGLSGKKIGENKLTLHSISAYAAMGLDMLDTNFSLMLAFGNNKPKEIGKTYDDYKSMLFGLNAGVVYPLTMVEEVNLAVIGNLGFSHVSADEHAGKMTMSGTNKIPKYANSIINLGLGVCMYDNVPLDEQMNLDYKLSLGLDFAYTSDDKLDVPLNAVKAPVKIKVEPRKAAMYKFNLGGALNLHVNKNVSCEFDAGLGYGDNTFDYGISLAARYRF